jgi:hypothetical protein
LDADLVAESKQVLEAIRDVAQRPLAVGAADLRVSSVGELNGSDADRDCPVVVLSPRRATAARVTVEIHDREQWVLAGADGPGFEFYAGMRQDRYALLRKLVRAIVTGDFEYGWQERRVRRLLRPWSHRVVKVWVARYGSGADAEITEHWARTEGEDLMHRRFHSYQ